MIYTPFFIYYPNGINYDSPGQYPGNEMTHNPRTMNGFINKGLICPFRTIVLMLIIHGTMCRAIIIYPFRI